jgi:hypothetical protein
LYFRGSVLEWRIAEGIKEIMGLKKQSFRFLSDVGNLVRENKVFFLAPLVIAILFFVVLFIKIGPGVIMTFIYAGL